MKLNNPNVPGSAGDGTFIDKDDSTIRQECQSS